MGCYTCIRPGRIDAFENVGLQLILRFTHFQKVTFQEPLAHVTHFHHTIRNYNHLVIELDLYDVTVSFVARHSQVSKSMEAAAG